MGEGEDFSQEDFELLLLKSQERLKRYVDRQTERFLKGIADRVDVLQETNVQAFKSWKSYKHESGEGFWVWLRAIARNEVRRTIRKHLVEFQDRRNRAGGVGEEE